ncbi:MAG: potassium channel family protein [Athalassotoga sp.]|uniref:potassium channel family protein n=1 Tax=Athalassotoga sp. TaxID=2022597 RepID=UPI003D082952
MEEDLKRRIKHVILAFSIIVGVFIFGIFGYMIIEKWDIVDALFMTAMTLSTVGYGLPKPLDYDGYLFTTILILIGISSYLYAIGVITSFFLDGDLRKYMKWKRMMKMINKMEGHCIVMGGSEIGKYVIRQLANGKYPFVFVTPTSSRVDEVKRIISDIMNEENFMYVVGDAMDEQTLLKAGISKASTLVVTLSDDSLNVYVSLMARNMNKGLKIISEADNVTAIKRLRYAGVDNVLSATEIVGSRIASLVLNPALQSFMDIIHQSNNIHLKMEEILVNVKSPLTGKTLKEAQIREKTGLLVVAIQSGTDFKFNPAPDTVINPGDILVVIESSENQSKKLREIAEG